MVVSGCRSSSSRENKEFHYDELMHHNIREKKGIKKTKKKNYPMVKSSVRTAVVSLRSSPLGYVSRGGTSATQRQEFHTDEAKSVQKR